MFSSVSHTEYLFLQALQLHRNMRTKLKEFLVTLDLPELAETGFQLIQQAAIIDVNFYRTFKQYTSDKDLLNTLEEFFEEFEALTITLNQLEKSVAKKKA